jgi:methylthioribose-1-phosphate isomerase
MTEHIAWKENQLLLLDQRLLPFKKVYVKCRTLADVTEAIKNMTVRGAPLIGIVAAYGMYLGIREIQRSRKTIRESDAARVYQSLAATRPTAVNLTWALDRMLSTYREHGGSDDVLDLLLQTAIAIHVEDIENNRVLGRYGAELIDDGDVILTHCNAGSLATGGYGTALGVIRAAHESGKRIRVVATETRPYLQGARLTAWELQKDGIPVTLLTDNMAGWALRTLGIEAVVTGADRIAANGDTANKIGTYQLAVLARHHGVPLYVAAPTSTLDRALPDGDAIPIEERASDEVTLLGGRRLAPEGVPARHPAFDVTPFGLITGIITEKGLFDPHGHPRD